MRYRRALARLNALVISNDRAILHAVRPDVPFLQRCFLWSKDAFPPPKVVDKGDYKNFLLTISRT